MRSKVKFILLLITLVLVVIGAGIFSINLLVLGKSTVPVLLIIVMIFLAGILSAFLRKFYYDLKAGIPSDDERTEKIRMYAAGYAYFISLYVWIILLAFHKYLDTDDILIIGLIGMAISFGVSWLLMKLKKGIA